MMLTRYYQNLLKSPVSLRKWIHGKFILVHGGLSPPELLREDFVCSCEAETPSICRSSRVGDPVRTSHGILSTLGGPSCCGSVSVYLLENLRCSRRSWALGWAFVTPLPFHLLYVDPADLFFFWETSVLQSLFVSIVFVVYLSWVDWLTVSSVVSSVWVPMDFVSGLRVKAAEYSMPEVWVWFVWTRFLASACDTFSAALTLQICCSVTQTGHDLANGWWSYSSHTEDFSHRAPHHRVQPDHTCHTPFLLCTRSDGGQTFDSWSIAVGLECIAPLRCSDSMMLYTLARFVSPCRKSQNDCEGSMLFPVSCLHDVSHISDSLTGETFQQILSAHLSQLIRPDDSLARVHGPVCCHLYWASCKCVQFEEIWGLLFILDFCQ